MAACQSANTTLRGRDNDRKLARPTRNRSERTRHHLQLGSCVWNLEETASVWKGGGKNRKGSVIDNTYVGSFPSSPSDLVMVQRPFAVTHDRVSKNDLDMGGHGRAWHGGSIVI